MIKRRCQQAELGAAANCNTFRATGITAYLLNGGTLEPAQANRPWSGQKSIHRSKKFRSNGGVYYGLNRVPAAVAQPMRITT